MRTNYKNFTNEKNEVNNEMLRDILKNLILMILLLTK